VPKAGYRVTNWPEAGSWPGRAGRAAAPDRRRRPRGPDRAALLATVFRLPLRRAEGLARSIPAVFDPTTLAKRRRGVSVEMNTPGRRGSVDLVPDRPASSFTARRMGSAEAPRETPGWRKLHVAVDAGTGEIFAHAPTDSDAADVAGSRVARAGGRIRSVSADGAGDGAPVDAAIRAARPPRSPPTIVVPPSAPSMPERGVARAAAVGAQMSSGTILIAPHGHSAAQRPQPLQ